MIPTNIREAARALTGSLPGALAENIECEGSKFHSPNPLVLKVHDLGGQSYVWLCPTCEANLDLCVRLLSAYGGALSWEVRREFGNRIRALAFKVWSTQSTPTPA